MSYRVVHEDICDGKLTDSRSVVVLIPFRKFAFSLFVALNTVLIVIFSVTLSGLVEVCSVIMTQL